MSIVKDRTKNSTQDRIVEAAVQLFSRQGFNGSSTSEIARLAGVSEVTVFRHFNRKRDLFWAAIESRLRRLRISKALLGRLAADEHPRTALSGIIALLVETVRHQPETIRLLYVALFELDHGSERVLRKHLNILFEPVREYLSRCATKGFIRDLEPGVAALSLAASVAVHHSLNPMLSDGQSLCANTDEAIAAYTDFWMRALVPETGLASVELKLNQAAVLV